MNQAKFILRRAILGFLSHPKGVIFAPLAVPIFTRASVSTNYSTSLGGQNENRSAS
jgi:hypothetical protein